MTQFNSNLTKERWFKLSLFEQMANIGSEVHRAIAWKAKDPNRSAFASDSALELADLTIEDSRHRKTPAMKELCRMRECLADYFYGDNAHHSKAETWEEYFYGFGYAANIQK